MTAKAIAMAAGKPIVGVNHLEGHALTARLTDDLEFPFLLLLVSGGHSQFLLVRGVGDYERLGTTIVHDRQGHRHGSGKADRRRQSPGRPRP